MLEKAKKIIHINYKWIILFISLLIFLQLLIIAFNQKITTIDIIVYKFITNHLISTKITPIAKLVTWMGSSTCLITLTIIFLITIKNKYTKILIITNLITTTLLSQALKFIVKRPRPEIYPIINETGYSFPSGHSMVSMAFYGLIIYLIYKNISNKKIKYTLISLLLLLITLIGLSRIYLGVHYTTDVIAGFLVSISHLILFINLTNKKILKKKEE